MKTKKRSVVEWAMHYRQVIILITCCLMAFGVYGLSEMKKNEFPDFTIRQGVVAAVYPELLLRKWKSRWPSLWKTIYSVIRR